MIEFSVFGDITSITAGAGVGSVAPVVLAEKVIPNGAQAYIVKATMKAIDTVGADKISFAIRHNGILITPWNKISGVEMIEDPTIIIDRTFGPGLFQIIGNNTDAIAFDCLASFLGYQF